MIESLRIQCLAVVEEAQLEFGPGLNVLTGETGAGKSLVLGALALLAGSRASSDVVREGADEAVVEAVFRSDDDPELAAELEARGLEAPDHELIVRRTVSRSGRSRARIGGALVPVATLAELFAGRIEVSSQHESQALLRAEAQGRMLDAYAGLLELRGAVQDGVRALRERDGEIAQLRADTEDRARREDFLAYQVKEIDAAGLEPGELETALAERTRRLHAERLRGDADAAARLLAGDPELSDAASAEDLVADAVRRVEGLAALDGALAPLLERLRDAHAEVSDAATELARYAGAVDSDAGRLAELEARLAELEALRRKYGPDEGAILAFRDRAAEELATLGGADARLGKLEAEREAEAARVAREAASLSRGRKRAARRLSRAVEQQLAGLAMADARFEVALEPAEPGDGLPCTAAGAELPEFRFSANPGEPPRSLRRVASGGELSRVFLALKNVLRRAGAGTALVFDEVDAGVSGGVADRVGAMLGELAEAHQVVCITHLPQVAARGGLHFRVEKSAQGARTATRVVRLDAGERVEEIARMAGGETVSEATRRHARALLEQARS